MPMRSGSASSQALRCALLTTWDSAADHLGRPHRHQPGARLSRPACAAEQLEASNTVTPLLTACGCVWQGLRWSTQDADGHQFPKLRLQFKPNLVSLAGGMTSLPVTDPQARVYQARYDLSGYAQPGLECG